jgi:zinc transport system permease protein
MFDILTYPFMQYALIAGVMVGFLASYYGVFVVQRGLSFLGDGLAHAAFGGVALGILLCVQPLWIGVPFTVIVAIGITWVRNRTRLASDTVIGIFFATSMALGIIFLRLTPGYSPDALGLLFGSILTVNPLLDLWIIAVVTVVSLFTIPLWGRWSYATFDREMGMVDRLPVLRDDYLISVLIAITVVVSVKVVGIVLVAAFLVIPAATGRLMARTFSSMTWYSIAIGVFTAVVGLLVSFRLNLPSGATIVLTQGLVFVIVMLLTQLALGRGTKRREAAPATPKNTP